ncbi:flagellar hook-associated protein FlgL [uncultured Clostridium sp.]|jgi:flagellin|uniref:flagellar hook-associated protein FlgL n=1 Tax=uncultured Clostridium sp. TaxID=59620 RepID=UPI0025E95EE0|nr:flagellar hook-associated protein FlgL [uncultured Clostridium sp.]
MRINTNLNAMTALNSATKNTALAGSSMEKLSSGLKINKAADNATGLAISEKMRSQIRGLDQASQNTQDGISVVQTAEGAIEEVGNIVQRMRELAVQGANETNTGSDRAKISEELTQLHEEIDRIAESTQFNGKDLLNGTNTVRTEKEYKFTGETNKVKNVTVQNGFDFDDLDIGDLKIKKNNNGNGVEFENNKNTKYGIAVDNMSNGKVAAGATITVTDSNGKSIKFGVDQEIDLSAGTEVKIATSTVSDKQISGKEISLQVGANTADSQTLKVKIENVSTKSLGLDSDIITKMGKEGTKGTEAANKMIDSLDNALERVNTSRANLGAMQNRLETTASNLTTSNENLTAAESRIRDVDVAEEMMNLSKLNLINQAAQAMMSQAKSQPEGVMQLLR